jgi:hypothetical protein
LKLRLRAANAQAQAQSDSQRVAALDSECTTLRQQQLQLLAAIRPAAVTPNT